MNLSETLKSKVNKKATEHAKKFANEIKSEIIETAEKGYEGLRFDLSERKDSHILRNDSFLEELETQLEGCRVGIDERRYRNLLGYEIAKDVLFINWG